MLCSGMIHCRSILVMGAASLLLANIYLLVLGNHDRSPNAKIIFVGLDSFSALVGLLASEASGATRFQYDDRWLEWEHRFAISLSLPMRTTPYQGAPVVAVFDNLLPDNPDIRRRVAERTGA
jgi:HipA-like protein